MNPLLNMLLGKNDLPVLPDIIAHISKKLSDPDSTIEEIAGLIQTEPVLTGNIIRLSNTVLFGGQADIRDLKNAVVRIGMNEIKNMVYSVEMLQVFKDNPVIDQKMFWRHSLAVAMCAQFLSKTLGGDKVLQEASYTAGLMHDMGILVYAYLAPKSYEQFLKKNWAYLTPGKEFYELHFLEKKSFDLHHAELGAAYIEAWWPIDELVISAVAGHHSKFSEYEEIPDIVKYVSFANKYCNSKEVHNGVQRVKIDLTDSDYETINLSDDKMLLFQERAQMAIDMAEAMISF
ncbi:MAG: HDOD domain-containing protein [Candidatus Electryonea clarkiae]|nr:HDOD domain-containing protein [Candidatus Electryonea clarkiae]